MMGKKSVPRKYRRQIGFKTTMVDKNGGKVPKKVRGKYVGTVRKDSIVFVEASRYNESKRRR